MTWEHFAGVRREWGCVGCEIEGSMSITTEEQALIVRVATDRDNCPSGLRDAVHEMVHVLDTGLGDSVSWDREVIHEEIVDLSPSEQFRFEVRARACERVACESAGIDYDVEHWAALAAMESIKGVGVSTSLKNWVDIINVTYESGTGAKLFEQVRELAKRLGT